MFLCVLFFFFFCCFFFFTASPSPLIYILSLHDALPICGAARVLPPRGPALRATHEPLRDPGRPDHRPGGHALADRKSTRLNSSHRCISYAVFCLKKKKNLSRN